MWVFIEDPSTSRSSVKIYQFGFYRPSDGAWITHEKFASLALAAQRVHYLNGGD